MEFKRIWKGFWQVATPMSWIASTIPMVIGALLAYEINGSFSFTWFVIALIGIYFIEIGKNALNKYYDFIIGVDGTTDQTVNNLFSGDSKKAIITGQLSRKETFIISVGTILAGIFIGLLIVLFREPKVIYVGLVGVIIAVFYTIPPFKLSYHGLGELSVGIAFGPIVMSGIYLVMTNTITWELFVLALPISFLVTNILIVNEIPDYLEDLNGGKRNLIVKFGVQRGIDIYASLFILAFISLVVISIVFRNPLYLIGLITVPLASSCIKIARKHHNEPNIFIKANMKTILIYVLNGVAMIIAILFGSL